MADEDLTADLVQAAEIAAALAGNEDRFRATFDAFLAADRESYQRLLTELKLSDRCELVCDWICSKYCIFVCLELCGPPIDVELPDLRDFAKVVTRITQDEELVERLANTVADRDAEGFRALMAELEIERFCHLLCHWACSVRCRLLCQVVCSPTPAHIASFVEELAQAGAVITTLAADERAMAEVTEAVLTGDCDVVRRVVDRLGLFQGCHLICEWLCTWRCVRVCLLLCGRFPIEPIEDPLAEAFAFARATARLAANPAGLQRLGDAVANADPETFGAVVDELELGRFCIQLCHWLCRLICRRFCFCVCPPRSAAYFIKIGQYEYAEVYPPGGTVPRIDSQIGGTGLTSDSRAFFETLRLNGGFTLQTGAPQMEYRFETITTDAVGNPVPAGATWQPVLAGATASTIIGHNLVSLFPLIFAPVFAVLDAQGWIQVPLSSPTYVPTGDLLELNTLALTSPPHLDETGVLAGAHASLPLAEDVYFGIRMRVRNVGDPASRVRRRHLPPHRHRQHPLQQRHAPARLEEPDGPARRPRGLPRGHPGTPRSQRLRADHRYAHRALHRSPSQPRRDDPADGWPRRPLRLHPHSGRGIQLDRLLRHGGARRVCRERSNAVRLPRYAEGRRVADQW